METLADRRGLSSDPRTLDNLTLGDLLVRYRDTLAIAKEVARLEPSSLPHFPRLSVIGSRDFLCCHRPG
jgi:hypothetical protein